MNPPLIGFCAWLLVTPAPIETSFEQLAPTPVLKLDEGNLPIRRPEVSRAVVLLHGLRIQPVSAAAARRAEPSLWEMPQGPLVQAISKDSDVFGFHYAQTSMVDEIARSPALIRSVNSLREAGYSEIVFVGFSAGGIIARQFVEDQPNAGGVTKVVQVCSPNNGSDWTILTKGVRAAQVPFVESLKRDARLSMAQQRSDRLIPNHVEFVCLVTVTDLISDGVVRRDSQWPIELQNQGVPAETIFRTHVGAMYSNRLSNKVAELITTSHPRWTADQVKAARPKVLGLLSIVSER